MMVKKKMMMKPNTISSALRMRMRTFNLHTRVVEEDDSNTNTVLPPSTLDDYLNHKLLHF